MCMNDYLIKTAHTLFLSGKNCSPGHPSNVNKSALSSTDQSKHKNLSPLREKSCYSHSGRMNFLFSVAIIHSTMLEATKRPMRKCVSL